MKKQKGFTLIELLVVISIIALLMSMLMPALSRVRDQAKAVVCQAQVKQWGVAFNLYTEDNNGMFHSAKGGQAWLVPLYDYVKEVKLYQCPKATKTISEGGRQPFAAWEMSKKIHGKSMVLNPSYGINQWIVDSFDPAAETHKFWRTPLVKSAYKVPMIGDCVQPYLAGPSFHDEPPEFEGDVYFGNGYSGGEMKRFCVNRHNGSILLGMMDFSVAKVKLTDLWNLEWHRDWNPNNDPLPDWPDWMAQL